MKKRSTSFAAIPVIGLVVILLSMNMRVHASGSGHGNQVPCHAATSQSNISYPNPASYVLFSSKAVDKSTVTSSLLHVRSNQPGNYAEQTLIFDTPGQFSDIVTIKLSFPFAISNTTQISNVSLVATMESRISYDSLSLSNPALTLNWTSPTTVEVSYVSNLLFDRIEVWLSSGAASQVNEVRIFYASKPVPAPDLVDAHLRACPGDKVTFTATNPKGAAFKWYDQLSGGSLLRNGKTFTTPRIYTNEVFYVEAVLNGCVGPRIPVYVQVQPDTGIAELKDRTYGGPFDDFLTAIVPAQGGFILGGTLSGFDQSIHVARISSGGSIIWEKDFGGSGFDQLMDIIPTTDGGYLLGGNSTSSDGDITDGNNGGSDFVIIKIDAAGNIQWNKTFGGSDQEFLFSIVNTLEGGYLLGGNTASSDLDVTDGNNGSFDYWVVKIDASGNKQWDKTFGGSDLENLSKVLRASDGGYILGGNTESSNGDVTDINNGFTDFWLVKIDLAGNKVWDRTYGGSSYDIFHTMARDNDDGYVMAGTTESVDGDITDGNNGSGDGLILKVDALGNKIWDRTLGGDNPDELNVIVPLLNGEYLFGGITISSENGDVSDVNQGALDIWIGKLDASRNKIWDATFGGTADDQIESIQVLPAGKYMIAGSTQSFDGDLTDVNRSLDIFLNDFWLIQIKETECFDCHPKISFDNDIIVMDEQFAYPNPFSSQINFKNESGVESMTWELHDLHGKPVPVSFTTDGIDVSINTSNLEPGVYILKKFVGGQLKVQRLIKF